MGGCSGKSMKAGAVTSPMINPHPPNRPVVSFKSSPLTAETKNFINNENNSIDAKEDYLRSNMHLYLKHHSDRITSLVISPDSTTLISSSIDKTVRLWDLGSLKQITEISHESKVNQVSISPDGKSIFTLCGSRAIYQWDTSNFTQLNFFKDFAFRLQSFAISPKGKELYLGGGFLQSDNFCPIRIFDIESGTLDSEGFNGHRAAASALIFTSDKKFMISCSGGHYVAVQDNSVRLWNLSSKKNLATYSSFDEAALV